MAAGSRDQRAAIDQLNAFEAEFVRHLEALHSTFRRRCNLLRAAIHGEEIQQQLRPQEEVAQDASTWKHPVCKHSDFDAMSKFYVGAGQRPDPKPVFHRLRTCPELGTEARFTPSEGRKYFLERRLDWLPCSTCADQRNR